MKGITAQLLKEYTGSSNIKDYLNLHPTAQFLGTFWGYQNGYYWFN